MPSARRVDAGAEGAVSEMQVSEFVKERILALRREQPGSFQNIACARTNAMRYLPNYFSKGQLQKLFFLFPDPHFKARCHMTTETSCSGPPSAFVCPSCS